MQENDFIKKALTIEKHFHLLSSLYEKSQAIFEARIPTQKSMEPPVKPEEPRDVELELAKRELQEYKKKTIHPLNLFLVLTLLLEIFILICANTEGLLKWYLFTTPLILPVLFIRSKYFWLQKHKSRHIESLEIRLAQALLEYERNMSIYTEKQTWYEQIETNKDKDFDVTCKVYDINYHLVMDPFTEHYNRFCTIRQDFYSDSCLQPSHQNLESVQYLYKQVQSGIPLQEALVTLQNDSTPPLSEEDLGEEERTIDLLLLDVNIASSSEVVLDVSTISRIDNYCQKAIASAKIKEL